jgi:hypothetical protein
MGCGKRWVGVLQPDFLFEGVLLPQADGLMGWLRCGFFRGEFIFFYPFTTLPGVTAWQ